MAEARKTDSDTDLTKLADELKGEIAALRDDISKRGAAMARSGRAHAESIKDAAASAARKGYARGEETLEDVLAEIESLEDELAEATRRRPFAALGLAALVGFLAGVLFRR